MCSPASWSPANADEALRQLHQAVLERDSKLTARNAEIAAIQVRYGADLAVQDGRIARFESELELYYTSHREEIEAGGKKSLQLGYGTISMRAPSNPSLVPLDGWTWEKIASKLKRLFKKRFFHDPKPPAIDKVKVKKELDAEELAKVGLRIESAESFHIELNQLTPVRKAA